MQGIAGDVPEGEVAVDRTSFRSALKNFVVPHEHARGTYLKNRDVDLCSNLHAFGAILGEMVVPVGSQELRGIVATRPREWIAGIVRLHAS